MSTAADGEISFEVAANVDITKLPLTPEEGFVISRILGRRVTLGDIAREGVVQPNRARAVLDSLVKKGALILIGIGTAKPKNDGYEGMIFSAADMAEPVDLTEEQKKRILLFDDKLSTWSHYRLLGVRRTAPVPDVKAGYFKVSKEFHPDAFFRKNLGSYKEKLDRIFKAMKIAYDTLSDSDKRAKYDETVVVELTPEEELELMRLAEDKKKELDAAKREERTAQRMKDARLKRNPLADRIKRGRELMQLAEQALTAGKVEEAANQARLAMTYDEGEALKARAQKIVLESERGRANQMVKRIQGVLASPLDMREMQDEIQRLVDQAAEIATQANDGPLLVEVSKLLLTLKRPVKAAKLAQQATEIETRNPRAWEALAEATTVDQKWALTMRACDRWLALEPGAARAKTLMKDAKRNT